MDTIPQFHPAATDELLAELDSLEQDRSSRGLTGLIELADRTVTVARSIAGAIIARGIPEAPYPGIAPAISSSLRLQRLMASHKGPTQIPILSLELLAELLDARRPIIEARQIALGIEPSSEPKPHTQTVCGTEDCPNDAEPGEEECYGCATGA